MILGPTLFNIQVNNLDDGIERVLSKFVDNTKLSGVIDTLEGRGNINQLEKWPEQDLTMFSKDKCRVLQLGRNNPVQQYRLKAN